MRIVIAGEEGGRASALQLPPAAKPGLELGRVMQKGDVNMNSVANLVPHIPGAGVDQPVDEN